MIENDPLASAVAVPREVSTLNSSTALPASAVPADCKKSKIKLTLAEFIQKNNSKFRQLDICDIVKTIPDKGIDQVEQTITKVGIDAVAAIPIPDIGEIASIPATIRQFWLDAQTIAEILGKLDGLVGKDEKQEKKIGDDVVKKIVQYGRSTFYCPKLQNNK